MLCCFADMAEDPADGEPSLKLLEPSGYAHGKPTEGLECMVTMEDITDEDGNYCEYQTAPSMTWHPAHFSGAVVRRLIYTQFDDYMTNVRKADCEADLKRRLAKGPPVWLEDKHGMPVHEDDTHICRVWLASDGNEYSAKLWHSVEVRCARARAVPLRQTSPSPLTLVVRARTQGAEREALWEELKKFSPPVAPGEVTAAVPPEA
jgi:hypothetical protein